ncbi:MAG: hypothetical protein WDO56_01135 [Gammaproteobacteria bacterium]
MRLVIMMCVVLAAGCATAPREAPVKRTVPIDATNIVPAQKAGYKIVSKDGKTLYCKSRLKTGTRLEKETSCLTEAEWQALTEESRRNVDEMRRTAPPKQGT